MQHIRVLIGHLAIIILIVAVWNQYRQLQQEKAALIQIIRQHDPELSQRQTYQAEIEQLAAELAAREAELAARIKLASDQHLAAYMQAKEATGITLNDMEIFVGVERETGVPWEFLAALYFTETTNGEYMGDCLSKAVHNARQRKAFVTICKGLGLDQDMMRVGGVGEMGPFQFKPLTWLEFGVDGNGDGIANPWNLEDAAHTAALYLQHRGYEQDDDAYSAIIAYKGGTPGKPVAERVTGKTIQLAKAMQVS